jgi:lactoylglutathione lyase
MKLLWTALHVTDLDASIAFYAGMAGLKTLRRFPAGPDMEIAFMGNGAEGETKIELLCDRGRRPADYGDSASVGFAVESLAAAMENAARQGIPVRSGPTETPSSTYFGVKDPDGFCVQFFQMK